MRQARAALLALALAAGGASLARAQISPNNNGPIDITSDAGDFSNSTCESTWRGSAEALQGQSRLRADVIKAFLKPKSKGDKAASANSGTAESQISCGPTDRLEADGNVFYVTPDQIARGDHAVYTADDDMIVMTGDVIVLQGKNVVRGDRLTIHVKSRQAIMDSDARGRGTPGRVRGVFYPNQAAGPGAPQAPGASPDGH
jgi:lipopolysaccharide export system protein LptA